MHDLVRRTLLWRLQALDDEIRHMAEDIFTAREQLKAAEEQLALMTEEHAVLAEYLTKNKLGDTDA